MIWWCCCRSLLRKKYESIIPLQLFLIPSQGPSPYFFLIIFSLWPEFLTAKVAQPPPEVVRSATNLESSKKLVLHLYKFCTLIITRATSTIFLLLCPKPSNYSFPLGKLNKQIWRKHFFLKLLRWRTKAEEEYMKGRNYP